jgi:hypothetical protein
MGHNPIETEFKTVQRAQIKPLGRVGRKLRIRVDVLDEKPFCCIRRVQALRNENHSEKCCQPNEINGDKMQIEELSGGTGLVFEIDSGTRCKFT